MIIIMTMLQHKMIILMTMLSQKKHEKPNFFYKDATAKHASIDTIILAKAA